MFFNGGTVLSFLHAQRVNEDALIGDGGRQAFEFGQLAAGDSGFFKDGRRFKVPGF